MDGVPPTPPPHRHRHRHRLLRNYHPLLPKLALSLLLPLSLLALFILSPRSPTSSSSSPTVSSDSWGGAAWEKRVRSSARPRTSPSHPRRALSVLVTGATGFIGTHVSASLKRRGDGVLGLDNFNSALSRARQAHLAAAGVFVVDGDVADAGLLRKLFDVAPFTHVLHLASHHGRDPASIARDVAGLVALLEAARSADPQPSFVWASSAAVYGLNSGDVPASESDRTDRPATLDAATKKAGEEITHAYNHIYGLSITALRLSAVYGPWGRPDAAYFSFTRDILRHKPISIFDGAQDFAYIDDVVKGCVVALDTAGRSTGRGGKKRGPAPMRVYNLGSASPTPVSEVVKILEGILKVKAERKMVRVPRAGDVLLSRVNITLAQRELGYRPSTDLKTGLKRFVRWYLEYYGPSSSLRKKSSSGRTSR